MGGARWALLLLFVSLVLLQVQAWPGAAPLNGEGLALLELRARVVGDPHGVFDDWDPMGNNPCSWSGVQCSDGKVEILNLTGRELAGTLAPQIGSLRGLRSLLLPKNNFHGQIPREFGGLSALEVLDLSANNLDGAIPKELGAMPQLKQMLVSMNWISFNGVREKYCTDLPSLGAPHIMHNLQSFASAMSRRLLREAGNLPALSGNDLANSKEIPRPVDVLSLGSGSFSAFPKSNGQIIMPLLPESVQNVDAATLKQLSAAVTQSADKEPSGAKYSKWIYVLIFPAAILLIVVPILVCRKQGHASMPPWRTGLSGQLQKAFVTGVPKLNRPELEAACEDFSNILNTFPSCTVFKGTLSSGVEICVVSTSISSIKDWPKSAETLFRKKIDTLSGVNHKNFVNLLGYCIENQPFMRMMVYEYAPNGTLSDHLHVKVYEHLDWAARMRIIMGMAYCLQYMHHELEPPVAVNDMRSDAIFMTDDYAAKIAYVGMWKELADKAKAAKEDGSSRSESPPDLTGNIFCYGALLMEIITGKLPEQDDHESICTWAAEHLKAKRYTELVDESLQDHKANELEAVCEVIQECTDPDPTRRPEMRDVTGKLREVLAITPEAAGPRLSPLWWAELELLSIKSS
ncbi:hypothetical protein ACQ4PT_010963 [Festuca glaucescens]